ncbi:hypothetical protein [Clostridium botulinum]|nr:hypothetical protein [Clostridium botulinum]
MSLIKQIKDIQKLNITTKDIKAALKTLTFDNGMFTTTKCVCFN